MSVEVCELEPCDLNSTDQKKEVKARRAFYQRAAVPHKARKVQCYTIVKRHSIDFISLSLLWFDKITF